MIEKQFKNLVLHVSLGFSNTRNNKSTWPMASYFHQFSCVWKPQWNTRTCFWNITSPTVSNRKYTSIFVKKIPLSRRVEYVADGSMDQSVSQWVRDVCMSHQSDHIYYKQPIKFLVLKVNGTWEDLIPIQFRTAIFILL